MQEQAKKTEDIKSLILEDPQVVLNDLDMLRAIVAADGEDRGDNIVDLKSVVLQKLETQLNKMEAHQQTILSAAYDNVATTAAIHKAVLDLLDPVSFSGFLAYLETGLAASLQVDVARLCLEAPPLEEQDLERLKQDFGGGVIFLQPGEIDYYVTLGRNSQARPITLRSVKRGIGKVHGERFEDIRSEALLKLDLGPNNRPALLVLASCDADQYGAKMGTDLLVFYASVFEKSLRSWLANE